MLSVQRHQPKVTPIGSGFLRWLGRLRVSIHGTDDTRAQGQDVHDEVTTLGVKAGRALYAERGFAHLALNLYRELLGDDLRTTDRYVHDPRAGFWRCHLHASEWHDVPRAVCCGLACL